MADGEKIISINIGDEMKTAYIDYSMSVIVSRALPDVRDGLKPVHRRVLYGMLELGVQSNRPFKKSARIVGDVMGKYHPHGDASIYDTMVRMAQPWSLRYTLVDGQGNFGSVDGDPPAAMRYTEARLKKIAEELLADIDKDTVDFQPTYDDQNSEPKVLPSKIPNLLINGSSGIAVGMATNMPPHNLTEVINGTIGYIENREITIDELMKFVTAPDFPTGGIIYGYEGVRNAFHTGRGRVVMRAKAIIEEHGGRETIIVTEIPYQVNKAEMIRKTADLIEEKKLEGISDIRDESDRDGLRVVYELKRDAIGNVVLNNLYKYTDLQTSFSVSNICLVDGRPRQLNLKDMIAEFVKHRHQVVVRRAKYELKKAEERAHILEGLIIASDNIDAVIKLIRASSSPQEAKDGLMTTFNLSEIQANAIVEMRLRQLTGLEQDKLRAEYAEVKALIEELLALLNSEELRMQMIKDELIEIRDKYGDERRTVIEYSGDDIRMEDIIADEQMVITISHMGYIKRTGLTEYRTQSRGGVGSKGSATRDEDFVEHIFMATNHEYLLVFTEKGKVYWMRVYDIPEGNKTSKGRAIQNLINIEPGDKVKAYINVKDLENEEYVNNNFVILCTKKGIIKKTTLEAYSRPRAGGIWAISIREGDQLLEATLTNGKNEIMLATLYGKVCRFNEEKVRPMGRNASGVRGINLDNSDAEVETETENDDAAVVSNGNEVIGMVCIDDLKANVLVVAEKGFGKRSEIDEYRVTNRGGKGVKTINVTEKTGNLIAIKKVTDENDLMIITKNGIAIRLPVNALRVMGRATQGVRLINLRDDDSIGGVAVVPKTDEETAIVTELPENGLPTDDGTEIENNNPVE